ncbi:MAG TPA: tetratricopeptide repeat protein, partial [Ramlibacter sp.]|nr:tetratricopeptide repeat protein [Ramlibacter sp.]
NAQAALDNARAMDARHPLLLGELALLAIASGDMQAAQVLLAGIQPQGDARLGEAHYQVATALLRHAQRQQAAGHLRLAIANDNSHALAHAELGAVLRDLGRAQEAANHLQLALQARPDLAPAAWNLAMLRIDARQWTEAVALLRTYLAATPRDADSDAYYWLGNAQMGLGDATAARQSYQHALHLDGQHVQARWGHTMAQLPAVAATPQEQEQAVDGFAAELDEMNSWFHDHPKAEGFRAVGAQQPYYLAYVDQDHRQHLGRYGSLCTTLMDQWARKVGVPPPAARGTTKFKLGIVSAHLHGHSVWHALLRGWIEHLDARRFEIHLFHTGGARDQETEWAARRVARLHHGLGPWTTWAKTISDGRFDALVYPEIGMDSTTVRLSALRLARHQLASWGHPVTTGLPTIDTYLSAQAFEPPDAAAHYTERLVALPRLGCAYAPYGTRAQPVELAAWNIGVAERVLLCPGTAFKYAPRDDHLLVEIARRCQPCKLVFFRSPGDLRADLLEQRLRGAFGTAGLDFEQCVRFIPWQTQAAFFGLLQRADLMLDSVGFSGFNTAMQAVECGTPIVAWEGARMRGRFASGILRELGMDEWIAGTPQDYAAAAERLCADAALRRQTRERIRASAQRLYHDRSTVEALSQLLLA